MTVRGWFLLALGAATAAACAQATQPEECVPSTCRASCGASGGSCIDGSCVCARPDGGGDADADTSSCDDTGCTASCISRGYAGGACLGTTCQCAGTPPDAGPDADADADADGDTPDDGRMDDGAGEDTRPDDAGADEAVIHDVGDPCTVADLIEQRTCGDGMKCTFMELSGTSPDPFCDRAGVRTADMGCGAFSRSDTCAAGLMCLNDGSSNRCRLLCRTDADCASLGPGAGCQIQFNIGGTTVEGIKACTFSCNVLGGSGCDTDQACRPSFIDPGTGIYSAYTDCSGVGAGTQGSDCSGSGSAACAARYQCFNLTTGGTQCLYLCQLAYFGSDCPAPASNCNDISDPSGVLGACL